MGLRWKNGRLITDEEYYAEQSHANKQGWRILSIICIGGALYAIPLLLFHPTNTGVCVLLMIICGFIGYTLSAFFKYLVIIAIFIGVAYLLFSKHH